MCVCNGVGVGVGSVCDSDLKGKGGVVKVMQMCVN